MSAIFERRSVRSFLPKSVEPDKIERLLRAGFEAPSAHNRRPWEFVVISARKDLDAIAEMSPYAKMCTEAAAAIIPCANLSLSLGGNAAPEDTWWIQDLAAATENILLQIVEEGLGGVWLGWYPDKARIDALSSRFGIPSYIVPFSVIALGYPAKSAPKADRFNASRVHYGAWD
ncbi:MAG: nitroreductase family protein [Treponema sp.]|jgi:nitroreductase|nr:nitroreductase family protein [Treponema sp.]